MGPGAADDVLLSAARLFVGVSVQAGDRIGSVSLVQLCALTVLSGLPGANLARLADGRGFTVSTASRLVDRLVAAGLAGRRPSEVTRREISISLTPDGRDLLARYDDLRLAALRDRLERLAPAERTAVVAGLQALVGTPPGRSGSAGQ